MEDTRLRDVVFLSSVSVDIVKYALLSLLFMEPLLCSYCICIEKEEPLRRFLLLAYNVFHILEFCIKIIKLLHLYILCSDRGHQNY